MKSYDWTVAFHHLYNKALGRYQQGEHDADAFFTAEERDWLASIGCRPMEIYDFVEDYPDIDWDTALLITAARRDYFLHVLNGQPASKRIDPDEFPAKGAEAAGIPWLPRIILKAKAKLRGEMPDSLMYCCGGDRNFLRKFDIHPADFLRLVWSAGENDTAVVDYVRTRRA